MRGRERRREGDASTGASHRLAIPARQGLAIALLTAALSILILTITQAGPRSATRSTRLAASLRSQTQTTTTAQRTQSSATTSHRAIRRLAPRPQISVRITTIHLVDPARTMTVSGNTVQRSFDVVVRYPVGLPGPFPLIVFGHGYNVTPAPYSILLDTWARAGYVVAAPIFPLENANAPGGPNENDLPNQPGDMSLVIDSFLRPDSSQLARVADMVDTRSIAVAGQSDGGDTALAAAYDPRDRNPLIRAAIILSGAEDPFAHPFAMPAGGPPLLAIQGTADTINPPDQTYAFFQGASAPKFLLKLIGAEHQPPYTQPGPELTEVEHMTLAFLNHYFKGRSRAFPRYVAAGSAGPGSELVAEP